MIVPPVAAATQPPVWRRDESAAPLLGDPPPCAVYLKDDKKGKKDTTSWESGIKETMEYSPHATLRPAHWITERVKNSDRVCELHIRYASPRTINIPQSENLMILPWSRLLQSADTLVPSSQRAQLEHSIVVFPMVAVALQSTFETASSHWISVMSPSKSPSK